MKKGKKDKWYRAYVEERFKATEKALQLQAGEYERRLTDLNGEAERLRLMQASYVPREVFEASVKAVRDKHDDLVEKIISPMISWKDTLQGKIVVIIVVGGAIWGTITGFVFYLLSINK